MRRIKVKKYDDGGKVKKVRPNPVGNTSDMSTLDAKPYIDEASNQAPLGVSYPNYPGIPIRERDDFQGSWLGAMGSGSNNRYNNPYYKKLTDLYRYYGGQPLKYDALSISNYKPSNSKDPNARYISINDDNFRQQVLDSYNRASKNGVNNGEGPYGEHKLNDSTYNVSGYHTMAESMALGHYTVSKGKDDKGEYISYYDKFDATPGNTTSIWDKMEVVKPFEIYDRIYLDSSGKPLPTKAMGGKIERYDDGGKVRKQAMDTSAQDNHQLYANVPKIDPIYQNQTLPPVTVVGFKNKGTRDFYDEQKADMFPKYRALIDLGLKYGFSTINMDPSAAHNHYNPLTNVTTVNGTTPFLSSQGVLDELPHKIQFDNNFGKSWTKWAGNDAVDYVKDIFRPAPKKGEPVLAEEINHGAYFDPKTLEYEAHSIIEPKLTTEFIKAANNVAHNYTDKKAMGGKITNKTMKIKIKKKPHHTPPPEDADMLDEMKNGGRWIQGAVNPDHKGYCTPMTKSTCTGKRRAFAETMKKHHGFHKKAYGGPIDDPGKKAPEGATVVGNPYPHVTQVTYPGDTLTNNQLMYAKAQMGRMKDYLPADMVYAAQFDKKGNQQTKVSYQYGHPHTTDAFMYKLSPTDLAKMSETSSELIKNPNIGFLPAPKAKGGIVRFDYGGPNEHTGPGWYDVNGKWHPMVDSTYRGNGVEVTPSYTPPGNPAHLPSVQPVNPYSASRNDQTIGGGRFGGGPTGQPTPQRTINRNNPSGNPSAFGPWPGDKYSGVDNSSRFGASDEMQSMLRQIGYPGPFDNKSAQTWLMQNYSGHVSDAMKKYGPTRAGVFNDGKWGVRSDMAIRGIMSDLAKNAPTTSPDLSNHVPATLNGQPGLSLPTIIPQTTQDNTVQPPGHRNDNGFSDMDYLSMADAFFSPIKKFYPIRVQNKFTPNRWFDVDMSAQRQDIKGQTTEANRAAAMIGNPSQVGASLASGIKGQALDALNQVDQQEFNTNQQGRFQTQVGNNAGFDQVYNQNQQFSSDYNDKMNALGQQVLEDKGFKRQQELLALQNAVKNRSSRQLLSQLAPNFPIGRNFDVSFMANPDVFQQLISRGNGVSGNPYPTLDSYIKADPDGVMRAYGSNTADGLKAATTMWRQQYSKYPSKTGDWDRSGTKTYIPSEDGF